MPDDMQLKIAEVQIWERPLLLQTRKFSAAHLSSQAPVFQFGFFSSTSKPVTRLMHFWGIFLR